MSRTKRFLVLTVILLTIVSLGFSKQSEREKIEIDVEKSHMENYEKMMKPIDSESVLELVFTGIPSFKPKPTKIKINGKVIGLSELKKVTDPNSKAILYTIEITGNKVKADKGKEFHINWPLKLSVNYGGKDVLTETEIKKTGVVELLKEPIPFHDAIVLAEAITEQDDRILEILKKYTTASLDNIVNAKNAFKGNPFLNESLKSVDTLQTLTVKTAKDEKKFRLHSETAPSAGFSVTKLADGMAKFLVERAKEELSIAFFQKFKKELEKGKYDILKTVFPETLGILQTIDEEIYNYSSYIQVIREAFEKDLSNMFANLGNVLELDKIKNLFTNDSDWLRSILITAFDIIDGLNKEKHPGDILIEFDTGKLAGDKLKNLRNAIKLLQVISNSLKEKNDGDRYWIDKDSLKKLFKWDEKKGYVVFNLYLGLIYQQCESQDIKFKIKKKEIVFAKDVLKKVKGAADKIEEIKNQIDDFVARFDIFETAIKELKQAQKVRKLTYEDYYKAYNTVLETTEYVLALGDFIVKNTKLPGSTKVTLGKDSELKWFIEIAGKLGDIYLDIKRRNYSTAIFDVIGVSDSILTHISGGKNKEEFKKIRAKFLKYGAFIAAVARAENSDEVKKAIEAAALPAGSYRIKRTRSFTISLNSYVGLFGSKESYSGMAEEEAPIKNLAITAPIGLAFNKGFGTNGKYSSSLSLFLSIIDLGAVVRFRFEEDENELSEVTWKDIFAPGAFLVYGPKNFPLSFGFGVQYGPRLTKVNESGDIETLKNSRIRWGLMIAVDIPLIHFK